MELNNDDIWCNCVIDCRGNTPVYDLVKVELEFRPNTRICNHYHNTQIIYDPFNLVIECSKIPLLFAKHLDMAYPVTITYTKTGKMEMP